MEMNREKCITCKNDTPYHFSTDIEYRSHYIEGAGQLCKKCWNNYFEDDEKVLMISEKIIKDNPNNYTLGEKVRTIYNKLTK
jgi:hypothetical protein